MPFRKHGIWLFERFLHMTLGHIIGLSKKQPLHLFGDSSEHEVALTTTPLMLYMHPLRRFEYTLLFNISNVTC